MQQNKVHIKKVDELWDFLEGYGIISVDSNRKVYHDNN